MGVELAEEVTSCGYYLFIAYLVIVIIGCFPTGLIIGFVPGVIPILILTTLLTSVVNNRLESRRINRELKEES